MVRRRRQHHLAFQNVVGFADRTGVYADAFNLDVHLAGIFNFTSSKGIPLVVAVRNGIVLALSQLIVLSIPDIGHPGMIGAIIFDVARLINNLKRKQVIVKVEDIVALDRQARLAKRSVELHTRNRFENARVVRIDRCADARLDRLSPVELVMLSTGFDAAAVVLFINIDGDRNGLPLLYLAPTRVQGQHTVGHRSDNVVIERNLRTCSNIYPLIVFLVVPPKEYLAGIRV